jgi:hypothetical protein
MTSPRRKNASHLSASSEVASIIAVIAKAMMMLGTTASLIMNATAATARTMRTMDGGDMALGY